MTDKKLIDSRRKLLKSIFAGSGAVVAGKSLPESWSKPIVDSVMLPAHAETTCCDIAGTYCGYFSADSESIPIEITVAAEGAITVDLNDGGAMLTGSVSCAGGGFDAKVVKGELNVTGTVGCGQLDITGFISDPSESDDSFEYTVKAGNCGGSAVPT